MNIYLNNRVNKRQSLLNVLFGKKSQSQTKVSRNADFGKRDTLVISAAGQEKMVKSTLSGSTRNTNVDSSINLQKYIDDAVANNKEVLKEAGDEINVKWRKYNSTGTAFRQALTEKYSRLVSEAKTHSNPESYIHEKYFDKGSNNYEVNLTDTERRIAYSYEMQMLRNGKISGVNYQDSLFRGVEINGDKVDNDKLNFERQLINSQISNILTHADIGINMMPDSCAFSVDPYSYYITVDGVGNENKCAMEKALNVGNNGKNLFKHIYKCETQDGINSNQVSKESKLKYEAFQQVYSLTGYKINELIEKKGTYYTDSGTDILDIVEKDVDNSEKIPKDFKQQTKEWIRELILGVSTRGWKNITDMNLKILYTPIGLKDVNQSVFNLFINGTNSNVDGSNLY